MVASVYNDEHDTGPVTLVTEPFSSEGRCSLAILSVSLGLHNLVHGGPAALALTLLDLYSVGQPGDVQEKKGIVGRVIWGSQDLTHGNWTILPQQIDPENVLAKGDCGGKVAPLTWASTSFAISGAEIGRGPISVDLTGVSRGHLFINGWDAGRYWTVVRGARPVQRYYLLPQDVLQEGLNTLMLWVEEGGNLDAVAIVVSTISD